MSHSTDTKLTVDEWGTEHLPLTSVALAAAVPIIEAELRERIALEIEAVITVVRRNADPVEVFQSTQAMCARIARGGTR